MRFRDVVEPLTMPTKVENLVLRSTGGLSIELLNFVLEPFPLCLFVLWVELLIRVVALVD